MQPEQTQSAFYPKQKFGFCVKCEHVIPYEIRRDGSTTFPRGEFLVHQAFITTGFESREEAQARLEADLAKAK